MFHVQFFVSISSELRSYETGCQNQIVLKTKIPCAQLEDVFCHNFLHFHHNLKVDDTIKLNRHLHIELGLDLGGNTIFVLTFSWNITKYIQKNHFHDSVT